MAQQTAVEWLIEQVEDFIGLIPVDIIQQAKEMEKQQIKDAWVNSWQESMINPLDYKFYEPEAEQYYNETYK